MLNSLGRDFLSSLRVSHRAASWSHVTVIKSVGCHSIPRRSSYHLARSVGEAPPPTTESRCYPFAVGKRAIQKRTLCQFQVLVCRAPGFPNGIEDPQYSEEATLRTGFCRRRRSATASVRQPGRELQVRSLSLVYRRSAPLEPPPRFLLPGRLQERSHAFGSIMMWGFPLPGGSGGCG